MEDYSMSFLSLPHDFISVSPSPLWINWVFELGWGWAYGVCRLRVRGQGLKVKLPEC